MPTLSRCFLTVFAYIALTLANATADEPIAVVSFAGYESLRKDIEYLDDATPLAPVATIVERLISETTGGQGLAGIDPGRPWGGLLYADGTAIAFVPVTDQRALLDMLSRVGVRIDNRDEDMPTIWIKGVPVLVRPIAGSLLLSKDVDRLTSFTQLPTKYLGDLPHDFDLAIRARPQRMPHAYRSFVVKAMVSRMPQPQANLENFLLLTLEQSREITIGWQLYHTTGRAVLDVTLKGRPGTPLHEAAGFFQPRQSRFAAATDSPLVLHGGVRLKIDNPQLLPILQQLTSQLRANHAKAHSLEPIPKAFHTVSQSYLDVIEAGVIDFDIAMPMANNGCYAIRFTDKHHAHAALSVMKNEWASGHDGGTAKAGTVTIGRRDFQRITSNMNQATNAEALFHLDDDVLFVGVGEQPEEALRRVLQTANGDSVGVKKRAPIELVFDLRSAFEQLRPDPVFDFLAQIWDDGECQVGFHMGESNGGIRCQTRLEPGVMAGFVEALGVGMIFSGASE